MISSVSAGTFSGRAITGDDMELIRWAASTYPKLSRSELAGTVCEFLGWVTPAGRAKIPQCLACFAELESRGLLALPPPMGRKPPGAPPPQISLLSAPETPAAECGGLELEIAKPGGSLRIWREYVAQYHALGDKKMFGSRLHYFIKSDGRILGCLQFSASAWALKPRDEWIGWSAADRKERLHLIANNSRFVIAPSVRIKNLASRTLSIAAKQIKRDWLDAYSYAPVLLETFVDTSVHRGTIYKASNWLCLGHTQGRGRMDCRHDAAISPKAIFVYPLQPDFKDVLTGKKPCLTRQNDDF